MSSFFKDFLDLRDVVKEAVDPIKDDIKALSDDFKSNVTEIQNIVADPKMLSTEEATLPRPTDKPS